MVSKTESVTTQVAYLIAKQHLLLFLSIRSIVVSLSQTGTKKQDRVGVHSCITIARMAFANLEDERGYEATVSRKANCVLIEGQTNGVGNVSEPSSCKNGIAILKGNDGIFHC